MAPKMKISVGLAKALQLRESGHTDRNIAKGIGRDDAAYIRNNLFAWVKKQKLLIRRVVMWQQLLELIDSGKVDHEPDARRLIAARAAGRTWNPDEAGPVETDGAPVVDGIPVAPRCHDTADLFEAKDGAGSTPVAIKAAPQRQQERDGSTPVALPFTQPEVEALKMVAAREMRAPDPLSLRSGDLQPTHYRVDTTLKRLLGEHARREGIKVYEALNRALEAYLAAI